MGAKLTHFDLFGPIIDQVKIPQKSVKDTPTEKLYDGFIGILSGAQGIVEVNTLVRSDPDLQKAFGRDRCAEQSVLQETLDASTVDTVEQMESAIAEIYRRNEQR